MEDGEKRRGGKRSGRRSSILKIKNPLIDLDPNKPLTDVLIPRKKARISSSRRVSFAETTQVKEFPRDSPHRWMPDPSDDEDESSPELERIPGLPIHKSHSEIQDLDKLLTGVIQNGVQDNETDGEYGVSAYLSTNHTILQDEEMDMTDCIDKSHMIEDFGNNIQRYTKSVTSISDRIYLPEKKYSNGSDNRVYKIEQESDFRTLVNTSINKYVMAPSESLATIAGTCNISISSSVSVTARKPLWSIENPASFTPTYIKDDVFEDKTVMFDNNDMEETEVITKCFHDDEPLISENVKIPSFLKASKIFQSDDNKTVIFGKDNDMEQTEILAGSIGVANYQADDGEKTTWLTNDMEETAPLTTKINTNLASVNQFTGNKTVMFGNDMEQTQMVGGKINLGPQNDSNIVGEKTLSLGSDMEQTQMVGGKIKLGPQNVSDTVGEKTLMLGSDMEQTQMIGGKIKLGLQIDSNTVGEKTLMIGSDMEQTQMVEGKIKLGLQNVSDTVGEKTLMIGSDMEQTQMVGGKIKLGPQNDSNALGEKTLMLGSDMEQTQMVGGKIKLGPQNDSDTIGEKTLILGSDMEQTQMVGGKIKLGPQNDSDTIGEKTLMLGSDMEQTQMVGGKLKLGLQKDSNTRVEKTIMCDHDMEETLGNIELPSIKINGEMLVHGNVEPTEETTDESIGAGKEIVVHNEKHDNQKHDAVTNTYKLAEKVDTLQYTSSSNMMEETNVFSGNIDMDISISRNITNENDRNSVAITKSSDCTKFSTETMEETKAITGVINMEDLEKENEDVKGENRLENDHTEGLMAPKTNNSVKELYNNLIKDREITDSGGSNTADCGKEEKIEEDTMVTNVVGPKTGGMMSLIQKLRNDMKSEGNSQDNSASADLNSSVDNTDGFFMKYKSVFENMKVDVSLTGPNQSAVSSQGTNQSAVVGINIEDKSGADKTERNEKSASNRRSLGLQSRTPLGKPFSLSRDACSEMRPRAKGSTIKLSERVAQTEHKTTPEGPYHPATCSKELFSQDKVEDAIDSVTLPDMECSVNVTIRNRSKSEASENTSLVDLPTTNHGLTGITDEQIPMDMLTSSSVTSGYHPDHTGSSCESRSMIDCNVEEFLKQSMLNETEGPMTVDLFLKRLRIPVPSWLSTNGRRVDLRRSIASLERVDKETKSGRLIAKLIHQPTVEVYGTMITEINDKLPSLKQQSDDLSDKIQSDIPTVFGVAMTGSSEENEATRESMKNLAKFCAKSVDLKWKEMKLECHKKYHDIVQNKRQGLSEEVDRIVKASDDIQQKLPQLSKASEELENFLHEFEQMTLPSEEDMESWRSSSVDMEQKQKEINNLKASRLELERQRSELLKEKDEIEKARHAIKTDVTVDDSDEIKSEIKSVKDLLIKQTSLLEWQIENYEDDFMTFLFDDRTIRLSINKQREADSQETKITSAHVRSLLHADAKPAKKLMHSIALDRITGGTELLNGYTQISQLPELLHRLSQIVLDVRNLHRQISLLSLKYMTTVNANSVLVEKWSMKTLRKVNIKFSYTAGSFKQMPEVSVTMGDIRVSDVQKQLDSVTDGANFLTRLCDSIDLDSIHGVR